MTEAQRAAIGRAVDERQNIVVVGGTGSGKTTLANAVLQEIADRCPADRLVLLEDTVELQPRSENVVALRTADHVPMSRLLPRVLRLRPDRIVVGEVRDGAALDLLKSWNTGHPGGVATIHANSARAGLTRRSGCQPLPTPDRGCGQPRAAGSPFGGVKFSGRAREGGRLGIEEFLEVKAISGWAAE